MKKQFGVFLALGLLLVGIGYKWQMQGIDSAIELKDVPNRLRSLEQRIKQKEKELERAGRFEEFEIAKQLSRLREQKDALFKQAVLSQHMQGMQEKEKIDVISLPEQLESINEEIARKKQELNNAADAAHEQQLQTEINTLEKKAESLSNQILVLSQHIIREKIPALNCPLSARFLKFISHALQHNDWVNSAAFSPDGSRVVTASNDRTARIWDAASGQQVGKPLQHNNRVGSAVFSPDGSRVVTASSDRTARIWNAATGQQIGKPLQHNDEVTSAAFSPDGSKVVTALGAGDKTARIWDVATGQQVGPPLQHTRPVVSAAFSPDGSKVVTASYDKTARLWDAISGQPVGQPLQHNGWVVSAAFSPDGSKVVTASWDGTARLWDVATGQQVGPVLKHNHWVYSVAFSPDGSKVVSASSDHTARIWNAISGQQIGSDLQHNNSVKSAGFSPDGSRVVTASLDRTARIWNAETGQQVGQPLQHNGVVQSAGFSPDGSRVVTASWDHTARIWLLSMNLAQCELLRAFDLLLQDTEKAINRSFTKFIIRGKPLPGRIQATGEQWHTFKSLPPSIQNKLQKYITAPPKWAVSK